VEAWSYVPQQMDLSAVDVSTVVELSECENNVDCLEPSLLTKLIRASDTPLLFIMFHMCVKITQKDGLVMEKREDPLLPFYLYTIMLLEKCPPSFERSEDQALPSKICLSLDRRLEPTRWLFHLAKMILGRHDLNWEVITTAFPTEQIRCLEVNEGHLSNSKT
jgi:hypothetical protein